jgi:DNA-binding transcriptional ArsR family regulator
MAKKSFLLVSLNENKAKKLAEVISNNTCRKILDFMAEKKDVTESELAKELSIPISTVHYNMQALLEARLVKSDEYHYSEKGKEVSHYRLANQYVIIAPEGEKELIREKLKSIIPTALIMGAAAGIIKIFSGFGAVSQAAAPVMMKAAYDSDIAGAMPAAAPAAEPLMQATRAMADEAVAESAPMLEEQAVEVVQQRAPEAVNYVQQTTSNAPEIALWFFIGAVAGVAVYLLVDYIVKRIRNRRR